MGWLIALGVLTGLAILPIGVSAVYNADGAVIYLIAGLLRIKVFPRPQKDKKEKPKKEKKSTPATKQPSATKTVQKQKGGNLTDFLPLVNTALEFLGKFRRKLRVKRLEMKLIMAGDDPCDLAVNYGKAWAALGNLMPLLEQVFVIKKRDLEVECDFTAGQTLVNARLDLTITLGKILSLAVVYGLRILLQFSNINKTRKGGADK